MTEGLSETIHPAPSASIAPLIGEEGALWRLRWRVIRTLLIQTFRHAWLRLALIVVLSLSLWVGLFWLSLDGFHFLRTAIGARDTHDQIVRATFGMFYASLMVMLAFSSAIILYGLLFRSAEAAFLLTMPLRAERIFLHKFQEALVFTCWGFVLLGSPVLLAYGIEARSPWYYYALIPPLMLGFVYIPSAVGAIVCLVVVRRMPRRRATVAVAIGAAIMAVGIWLGWSVISTPESNLLTPGWLQDMLHRLQFTDQRLLPSWWLSSGLLEASRGQWSEGLMFAAVMISNALLLRELGIWTAAQCYRAAYDALYATDIRRRRVRRTWFDRWLSLAGRLFPGQMRLMMLKDLRLFCRDPLQWTQFLVFFGLLGLYFINLRRFRYDILYTGWVNMVSFLNLLVVGLLLSTFNTRFVFPMISLEGRRFWILSLLPLHRETILWSKFLFASIGSMIPSAGLILISDAMLRISPTIVASHQLTCVLLSVGLAGIAVGLGARLPSLRQQSPSRIAAGFGGTLCLVISAAYIVSIVLLTAVPCHFGLAVREHAGPVSPFLDSLANYFEWWLLAGTVLSVLLAAIATVVPMWIGYRAFRHIEF